MDAIRYRSILCICHDTDWTFVGGNANLDRSLGCLADMKIVISG